MYIILIPFSTYSLLVYRHATDFCVDFVSCTFLNSFILTVCVFVYMCNIFYIWDHVVCKQSSLFLSSWILVISFSCLIALASIHYCVGKELLRVTLLSYSWPRRKTSSHLSLSIILSVSSLCMTLFVSFIDFFQRTNSVSLAFSWRLAFVTLTYKSWFHQTHWYYMVVLCWTSVLHFFSLAVKKTPLPYISGYMKSLNNSYFKIINLNVAGIFFFLVCAWASLCIVGHSYNLLY